MTNKNKFRTHLKLWLPDAKSPWGRRLKPVIKTLGNKIISMPRGFTFAEYYGLRTVRSKNVLNKQKNLWDSVFQPSQSQSTVFDLLTETLDGPCALRIFIEDGQKVHYSVIVNDGKRPLALARREIRGATREVFHHFLNVDPGYQSSGIGGRLLCNAVCWYKGLDEPKIDRIHITAGLSAGGSVWPKFGFRPVDEEEWIKIHKRIRLNMKKIPSEARKQFQQQTQRNLSVRVESILENPDPSKIWDISDFDYAEKTRNIRIPVSSNSEGHRLGTFLLRGTRWKGVLDLTNPEALRTFKNFFSRRERKSGIFYACKDI